MGFGKEMWGGYSSRTESANTTAGVLARRHLRASQESATAAARCWVPHFDLHSPKTLNKSDCSRRLAAVLAVRVFCTPSSSSRGGIEC